MKKIKNSIILFLIAIFTFSCKGGSNAEVNKDMDPIVTIKNETLYKIDIDAIIPPGSTAEDSTRLADKYVQSWINDRLIYNKAKENIPNEVEIDRLVNEYKKTLITNSYKELLFSEYLAKNISETDARSYLEQNKGLFVLRDNIIKGLYLKIPIESPELDNFRKWYVQNNDKAVENIEKHTLQNAIGYDYFYDRWVDFSYIMDKIPYAMTNSEQFLRTNKNLEARDSAFVYLLNIKEYKLIGDEMPYEYAKGYLMEVFKEKKREELIKQIEEDLYSKAVSNEEVKFYKK